MFGYVIKNDDNDFIVNVNPDIFNSGYNVVPKDIDPYGIFDIEEVRQYVKENPDKVISGYTEAEKIELQEYKNIQRQKIQSELDGIDRKTIRPLRAILSGLGTEEDKDFLAELETQAKAKREELEKLIK